MHSRTSTDTVYVHMTCPLSPRDSAFPVKRVTSTPSRSSIEIQTPLASEADAVRVSRETTAVSSPDDGAHERRRPSSLVWASATLSAVRAAVLTVRCAVYRLPRARSSTPTVGIDE